MDGAEVLRAVRRRQGWSQRELARRAGISDRAISAVEAGRRPASLAVLQAVVDAGGVDLALDLPLPAVPAEVRAHLRLSLTERLHRSLGGRGRPRGGNAAAGWLQLQRLAACGRVILHGQAAVGLWLPQPQPVEPVEVCLQQRQPREPAPGTHLRLVEVCDGHAAACVSVSLGSWVIGVDPPSELALRPDAALHRPALRAVARLLHDDASLAGWLSRYRFPV